MSRADLLRWAVLLGIALPGAVLAYRWTSAPTTPTLSEYVAGTKGSARVAEQPIRVGSRTLACGDAPVVLDTNLDDIAAAHPGYLILNPRYFDALQPVLRLYAFYHECGHQSVGPDEQAADCFAVRQGQQSGWLDPAGLDTICRFWKDDAGSEQHLPGPQRCAAIRACFAAAGS